MEKSQWREDGKGRKVAKYCVLPVICGSGGSKSKLPQAAGAEPAGQMKDENCTQLWREARFEVKMCKAPQLWTAFGSYDVEKVHAIVAQNTTCSDHCWTSRCRPAAEKVHALVAGSSVKNCRC